jgi:hypothetical protein
MTKGVPATKGESIMCNDRSESIQTDASKDHKSSSEASIFIESVPCVEIIDGTKYMGNRVENTRDDNTMNRRMRYHY